MTHRLRPIDQWFIVEVLPHEDSYMKQARRMSNSFQDAQDLVQETYAKLFALDGWAAIGQPQAYVHRMIRHLAIERLRRARVIDFQHLQEADHDTMTDDAPDPFAIVEGRERLARFANVLACLPARCREVFVRRRIDEQSPREISQELGVSLSTLEKRLARAYVLLAREGWHTSSAPTGARHAEEHDDNDQKMEEEALGQLG